MAEAEERGRKRQLVDEEIMNEEKGEEDSIDSDDDDDQAAMMYENDDSSDFETLDGVKVDPELLKQYYKQWEDSEVALHALANIVCETRAENDVLLDGHLGLNAIQRRYAKVSTGDTISVTRFVPPEDFNLALLTLDLEFVKRGTKDEQVMRDLIQVLMRKLSVNLIAHV